MKSIAVTWLLALFLLLSIASASRSDASPAPGASTSSSPVRKKAANGTAKLPAHVDIYATTDIGGGQQCLVGIRTDQDGLNQRPVVYLANAGSGFAWHVPLRIPKDMYQGRATHCVASGDVLYVLLQIDTLSQEPLNQTRLQVVQLSKKNGAVIRSQYVDVPNVSAAYTSWVDEGGDHFKLERGKLVIQGSYDLMSQKEHPTKEPIPFTAEVPESLRP